MMEETFKTNENKYIYYTPIQNIINIRMFNRKKNSNLTINILCGNWHVHK